MTFKQFSHWCNKRASDGLWGMLEALVCIDIYKEIKKHHSVCYHSGLVDSIVNRMWPITMPYCPDGTIKVYCEDFLTNEKNGDFDTVGIFYAIKSDGTKVNISRFFKKDEPFDTDWVELSREQYDDRKAVKK